MENIQETVFFGKARQDMEKMIGMSMQEMEHTKEIDLPPELFNYSQNALKKTSKDHHEYWALFKQEKEVLVIDRDGQGEEFDFKKGEASSIDFSIWENAKRVFFDSPASVIFHTHPDFSENYLRSKGIKGARHPKGDLSVEMMASGYDLATRNFSQPDLALMEANCRYYRSGLLTSIYGHRWIINPVFKIPFIVSTKYSDEYGRKCMLRAKPELDRIITSGLVDKQSFNDDIDQYLHDFCKNTGMLAFGNDNPNDKKLYKI